jgi:hypothetical protein
VRVWGVVSKKMKSPNEWGFFALHNQNGSDGRRILLNQLFSLEYQAPKKNYTTLFLLNPTFFNDSSLHTPYLSSSFSPRFKLVMIRLA